jgi:hypothetical protein
MAETLKKGDRGKWRSPGGASIGHEVAAAQAAHKPAAIEKL